MQTFTSIPHYFQAQPIPRVFHACTQWYRCFLPLFPTQTNQLYWLTSTQQQLLTAHFTALFDSAQEAPLSVLLYPPAGSLHSLHDCIPLLQSSTLAHTIRWSVPPLQSCVFIKHHNYLATRPEVGPYFPAGRSLWNCSLFYGRICRPGLLSRISLLCYLDGSRLFSPSLFFLFIYFFCHQCSSASADHPVVLFTPSSNPAIYPGFSSNKHDPV